MVEVRENAYGAVTQNWTSTATSDEPYPMLADRRPGINWRGRNHTELRGHLT